MKSFFKKAWTFVVKSSANPKATSLTVKGILLGAITYLTGYGLEALDIICKFGYRCYYVDPTLVEQLTMIANAITEGVFYGLMMVSYIITAYGIVRKVIRTLTGGNLALRE